MAPKIGTTHCSGSPDPENDFSCAGLHRSRQEADSVREPKNQYAAARNREHSDRSADCVGFPAAVPCSVVPAG